MRIEEDRKLDYRDVLIRPKRSTLGSRKDVDLCRQYSFRNTRLKQEGFHYQGIPVMSSNMDGVGTFSMADALAQLDLFTCLVKSYSVKELIAFFSTDGSIRRDHVAYSMGIMPPDFEKFETVYGHTHTSIKYVCVDVANGYSERFSDFIKRMRDDYPDVIIIAGNVVTGEMTEELILSGADIIKVGIGPGSVCTTRIKTGVGYPQISAKVQVMCPRHLQQVRIS